MLIALLGTSAGAGGLAFALARATRLDDRLESIRSRATPWAGVAGGWGAVGVMVLAIAALMGWLPMSGAWSAGVLWTGICGSMIALVVSSSGRPIESASTGNSRRERLVSDRAA